MKTQQLEKLGFSIQSSKPKTGETGIEYRVTVKYGDRVIYDGPFTMGIGNVNWQGKPAMGFDREEEAMFFACQKNPYADFKNKELQRRVAAKLAIAQKVEPDLGSVLSCLVSDGDAYFSAYQFEDWAKDLGYDPDSRKAEAIWRTCDSIGRKMAAAIPKDKLEKLREMVQDD